MRLHTFCTGLLVRCLLSALCTALPATLTAQITLTGSGENGALTAVRGTPYYSVEVSATRNGSPFLLTTDNVLITESTFSAVPVEVTPPVNGFQTVRWKYANHYIASSYVGRRLVVFEGNTVAEALISFAPQSYAPPYVQFQDVFATRLRSVEFGTVAPGEEKTISVEVRAITGRKLEDGTELSVPVDSIVLTGAGYSMAWKGNFMSSQPPPVNIISPLGYRVDITFAPSTANYSRGVLAVYYDGGLYAELILTGNKYQLPDVSAIRLLSPNGTERFAPCEDIPIRWQGHAAGLPTTAEYSTDGGRSWKIIGQSNDSTLMWRVPAEFSETALVRVSQQLTQSEVVRLKGPEYGVHALAFSSNGQRLLAGYSNGSVVEWNTATNTQVFTYELPQTSPGGGLRTLGIGYTANGSIAAVFSSQPVTSEPLLAIFPAGSATPSVFIAVPLGFIPQSAVLTPDGQSILFVPANGTQVAVYSATTGAFERTIDFPAPVLSLAFSAGSGMLGAALLDNTVRLLSVPDYTIVQTVPLRGLPMTAQLAVSSDNAYVAVASILAKATLTSGSESQINIIETATGTVVRTLRNVGATTSIGISFSSTTRYLAIGLPGVPQIGLWNLINDTFNGGLNGHTDVLTDIQFSPVGTQLATASVSATDNVRIRGFAFPESDISDAYFRIMPQVLTISSPSLPATFIGTSFDTTLTTAFCNAGEVPIILTGVRMESGAAFRLTSPFTTDTLLPGECLSFSVAFEPRDTGTIADRLIYSTCNSDFAMSLQAVGRNRTIAMLVNDQLFGEVCVGESLEREIAFLRNDDPIPLTINTISIADQASAPFTILTPVQDVVLQPGETLPLRLRFQPTLRGDDRRLFSIHHSGQGAVQGLQYVVGRGLGAEIALQKSDLRFIPEQPTRELVLTNTSAIAVTIDSVQIVPPGAYTVTTPLPVVIPAGGTASLGVEWNQTGTDDAALSTYFTPCAVAQTAVLGVYRATSTLSIPVVEADPRGEASVPVHFSTVENKPYNGTRVFETEFSVHAGLFLPTTVRSDFGEAQITRNDIVDGRRIIGVRVEGDFPTDGVAAVVSGPAGLADVTTSTLEFAAGSRPWGSAVQTVFQAGELRLTGVCGDRRILTPEQALSIHAVYPNPAGRMVTVEFDAIAAGPSTLHVVDALGTTILEPVPHTAVEGRNHIQLVLPPMANGSYRLIVRQGTSVHSAALTVRNQ